MAKSDSCVCSVFAFATRLQVSRAAENGKADCTARMKLNSRWASSEETEKKSDWACYLTSTVLDRGKLRALMSKEALSPKQNTTS